MVFGALITGTRGLGRRHKLVWATARVAALHIKLGCSKAEGSVLMLREGMANISRSQNPSKNPVTRGTRQQHEQQI
jgi:DNA polymerase II large subunit